MPVIPVNTSDWDELVFNTARLCINSESLAATETLASTLKGVWTGIVFQSLGFANMALTDEDVMLMVQAQRNSPVTVNPQDIRGFMLAGLILAKALRLAVHIEERASVKKAINLLIEDLAQTSQPLKAAMLWKLWKLWKKYQPVSHFAAAWTFAMPLFSSALQALAANDESNSDEEIPPKEKFTEEQKAAFLAEFENDAKPFTDLQESAIPKFFAIAEELRKLGHRHYSHGQKIQKHSLLDRQKTWTVPKSFKLPDIKLNLGPPLSNAEINIIEKRN